MSEPMSLDGILSGEKSPVEKAEVPEKTVEKDPVERQQEATSKKVAWRDKEQEAQGRLRDPETGQYAAKEKKAEEKQESKQEAKAEVKAEQKQELKAEVKAEVKADELTAKEKAAFAKAADETRKRQALERELAELRSKSQTAETDTPKTFWDDPEGALKRHEQQIQQAIVGTKLQTSEAIARGRYQDFDEKVAIFTELAQSVPGLAHQMLASPDPAEFVYKTAKNHKELQEAGGIDALRQKIKSETEAEVRARIEAELQAKAEALAKERAALPGSLSDAQSKGTNKPVWGGPTSLENILKS